MLLKDITFIVQAEYLIFAFFLAILFPCQVKCSGNSRVLQIFILIRYHIPIENSYKTKKGSSSKVKNWIQQIDTNNKQRRRKIVHIKTAQSTRCSITQSNFRFYCEKWTGYRSNSTEDLRACTAP